MTRLQERRNGAQDTNTPRIGSELDISPDKMSQFGSRRYHQILGKLPPLPQLAALLAIVGHPEFFKPECPDDTAFSCPEQLLQLCEEAIEMVKTLLAFSPDLCGYFYEFQTMLGCIQLTNLKDHTIRFLLPESYVQEQDDELDELPESEEEDPPNTPNLHFTHNEVDGSDIGIELMEVDEESMKTTIHSACHWVNKYFGGWDNIVDFIILQIICVFENPWSMLLPPYRHITHSIFTFNFKML
ncbi:hypothetical protein K439DRAFT_1612177 [Ramaria rubella]|nr:hypothetical protein K439DRAFT_1612177 [Ramaria rubella]